MNSIALKEEASSRAPQRFTLGNYVLETYFRPGLYCSAAEIEKFLSEMQVVNAESGRHFGYGVFDRNKREAFLTKSVVCIIKERMGHPVGFQTNVVVDESQKLVQQGLIVISRNQGFDLMYAPYALANIQLRQELGDLKATTISAIPKVIGEFSRVFSDPWPVPEADLLKPPPGYRKLAEATFEKYVLEYFPDRDKVEFNPRRFTLRSPVEQMGFTANMRDLSRDNTFAINSFCHFWLDYNQGEDLIMVGKFDAAAEARQIKRLRNAGVKI